MMASAPELVSETLEKLDALATTESAPELVSVIERGYVGVLLTESAPELVSVIAGLKVAAALFT